jgi:hypothetical protein
LLGDRPPVIKSSASAKPDPKIAVEPEIVMPTGEGGIVVGMSVDAAMRQFAIPSRATTVKGMPLNLTDPPFSVTGWQNASQGFGVISVDGKVGLAVRRLNVAPKNFVAEAVEAQMKAAGGEPPVTLSDEVVSYYFWERETQRVMINAVRLPDGNYSVTWAIGDITIMDNLRMNVKDAQTDMAEARKIREKSKASRKESPTAPTQPELPVAPTTDPQVPESPNRETLDL